MLVYLKRNYFYCFFIKQDIQSVELFIMLSVFPIFLCDSVGKESALNAGDQGSVPEMGRSPGEGNDNPLQYFCLETSMDWGAWWATVHGVAMSQTWLSDWTELIFRSVRMSLIPWLNHHQSQQRLSGIWIKEGGWRRKKENNNKKRFLAFVLPGVLLGYTSCPAFHNESA